MGSANNGDAVNALFEMYEDYESEYETQFVANQFLCIENGKVAKEKEQKIEEKIEEKEDEIWPQLGFDVITQCSDVLVHKMPICGHKMNRDSLLQYAISAFSDSTTMKLKCPHTLEDESHALDHGPLCNTEWDYLSVIDILQYGDKEEEEWTKYAKLELLASRNVIEQELETQKCPNCHTLYFKNWRENKKALDEIKTVDDIENEFKFECIFCPNEPTTITERVELPRKQEEKANSLHNEDDIEEDIDGDAVNALFGQVDEYESDDEDDEEKAIETISHMFDDDEDEPQFEENVIIKSHNSFCFCCGANWETGHVCGSTFKSDLV